MFGRSFRAVLWRAPEKNTQARRNDVHPSESLIPINTYMYCIMILSNGEKANTSVNHITMSLVVLGI